MTAVRTAVMVITVGIVDMCKKSTVRIGVVSHGPGVAARLFHGVLADDLFPCEKEGAEAVEWSAIVSRGERRSQTVNRWELDTRGCVIDITRNAGATHILCYVNMTTAAMFN